MYQFYSAIDIALNHIHKLKIKIHREIYFKFIYLILFNRYYETLFFPLYIINKIGLLKN